MRTSRRAPAQRVRLGGERWRDITPVGVMLLVGLVDGVGGLAGIGIALGAYAVAAPVSVVVWLSWVKRRDRSKPVSDRQ